jgi:TonB-linked SusC/RagA family outer membrane protein
MNENHVIQCVRRASKRFLSKYVILAALLCSFGLASAQNSDGKVSGTILSETNGEPLIGVSIMVKGTTRGTVTDFNGAYTVQAKAGETLKVSYIGFLAQEVKVSGSNLAIRLKEDQRSLDEVVVVGYGVQKKKLTTGASVQVKGDDISKLNTSSALTALQGQTPGVSIMQTSGQPGEGFKVNIRGLGTVNDATPLYIVDGVQTGDINWLNPSDIASLDVLKDAASAAIYGAKAANGVILVTTKGGKSGKMMVSYDAYSGVQNLYKKLAVCNAQEYALLQNEAAINSTLTGIDFADKGVNLSTVGTGTDWIEEALNKDALTMAHTINISGGSEKSVYSSSLSYSKQNGIFGVGKAKSNYERFGFRMNSEHNIIKNYFVFGQHLSLTRTNKAGLKTGNIYSNSLHGLYTTHPFLALKDANGDYTTNSLWNAETGNPIASMELNNNNKSVNDKLLGDVYAEIQPIKNLKIKSTFGVDYYRSDYRSYTPIYTLTSTDVNPTSDVSMNMYSGTTWSWENTANYHFDLGKNAFDVLAGASLRSFDGNFLDITKNSLTSIGFETAYPSNASIVEDAGKVKGGAVDAERMTSYFGRLNYNYNEKYLATFIMRADASSRFGANNRWGYFPSVSAGWVVTNEDFFSKNSTVLDYLKIRASWGQNGNSNIDAYQYLSTIATDMYYPFGSDDLSHQVAAYPVVKANPDLKWETSEQFNVGVDARFAKSRLNASVDLYNKVTKDWLIQAPQLDIFGTLPAYINGGDVRNRGVEISLNWHDRIGKVGYSIGGNVAHNQNKVLSIPNSEGIIHGAANSLWQGISEVSRAEVGQPIGYFWGHKTAGIFQNEAEVLNYKNSKGIAIQPNAQPGDVIYVDQNGDGTINDKDKTNIGDPNPDFTFGFNLALDYKAFDLSINASGVAGGQIAKGYIDFSRASTNYTTDFLSRWHGEGTSNKMPRMLQSNEANWKKFSDLYLEDGDYLKIQNVTLGFDFKKQFKIPFFTQLRLYLQAQNLYTFTKYSGMDPEIGYSVDKFSSGIDLGYYPHPRTYLIGLNIKF